MTSRTLRSSAGFTYIAAIVAVVIMGILLSQAGSYWKTRMQREREVELLYRGTQIRDAMRRWYGLTLNTYGAYTPPGDTTPVTTPVVTIIPANAPRINELKDLLQAPSSAGKKRYLRKLYLDPMTGKDFDLVKDANQRVVGVKSSSEAEPIKQANFPYELFPDDFVGKKKYSEWQFICTNYPKPDVAGGTQTGTGISNVPGTPVR